MLEVKRYEELDEPDYYKGFPAWEAGSCIPVNEEECIQCTFYPTNLEKDLGDRLEKLAKRYIALQQQYQNWKRAEGIQPCREELIAFIDERDKAFLRDSAGIAEEVRIKCSGLVPDEDWGLVPRRQFSR